MVNTMGGVELFVCLLFCMIALSIGEGFRGAILSRCLHIMSRLVIVDDDVLKPSDS